MHKTSVNIFHESITETTDDKNGTFGSQIYVEFNHGIHQGSTKI